MASSSGTSSVLAQILSFSVSVAKRSGDIIRSVRAGGNLEIIEKTGKNDLQTLADRSVSDFVLSSFRSRFPKELQVISEEGSRIFNKVTEEIQDDSSSAIGSISIPEEFQDGTFKDFTIWVDPLDGTKEFTDGFLDRVTVLIGIAFRGRSIAGVIHQPYYNNGDDAAGVVGRTIYGVIGSKVVGIESITSNVTEKIVTTTRSHSTGLVGDVIAHFEPCKVLRVGGAGYKVLLLMEGQAHAYVFPTPGCKKWDTCAPEALLTALGGKLTDIKGNPYEYHGEVEHVNEWGVLATASGEQHSTYVETIPTNLSDLVKDYFKKKS